MESPPILEKKRYHDLDALRATAMLLGILLHGVISFHDEAMPTCGFSQSSSVRPTARSIALDAAFWMPSVTSRERGLMSTVVSDSLMRRGYCAGAASSLVRAPPAGRTNPARPRSSRSP